MRIILYGACRIENQRRREEQAKMKNVVIQDTVLDLLKRHGIKQKHFAEKVGISPAYCSSWLHKKSVLPPDKIKRVRQYISQYEDAE